MVTITTVDCGSPASAAGIKVSDELLTINGNDICDILDYRFYLTEKHVTLTCRRNGVCFDVKINKGEYDDIGLGFETPLMDKKHSCRNKCIFCFIDQLPKGMRESLYFKDDDQRLSFLHGNYITLTNMNDKDIDRIIKMHISPVRISVHSTESELRCFMMNNKRAGETLDYVGRLCNAGISVDTQIVLCKGINDGVHLDKTIRWLSDYFPALESISVVPAGLTRYREGLYPLVPFDASDCRRIVTQINALGDEFVVKHGSRIVYAADEFYIMANEAIPDDDYYGEYPQLENGVGMLRLFETEFLSELEYADEYEPKADRHVSIATGVAAYNQIRSMADRLEKRFNGLKIEVYRIINRFFGESITVSGLLTGEDMLNQLAGKELGECLFIPPNALRADGDLFLCGMTPGELSDKLGVPVVTAPHDGGEWLKAVVGVKNLFGS